jgi:DNA replication protein
MAKSGLLSALDFKYVLLDSYKKMNISEEELMVILMADHLLEQGNSLITVDMLALKMNYKPEMIDKTMSLLVKRGYLSFDTGEKKKMKTSLEPLKNLLYDEFQKNLALEHKDLLSNERENTLRDLTSFFESKLERTLSPLDSQTLSGWIDAAFSSEEIKNALLDALNEGKNNLRAVDKVLRASRANKDIAKEGYTATSPSWDKDIDETLKIAKEMWGNDESKK